MVYVYNNTNRIQAKKKSTAEVAMQGGEDS